MRARGEAGPERPARILLRRLRIAAAERLGVGVLPPLDRPVEPRPRAAPHVLVVCHDVVRRGGLLRFARFGRVLVARGGHVALVSISRTPRVETDLGLPLLDIDAAARRDWDAVMFPGAGFPDSLFPRLALFRDPRFGLRVQHVLNDRSRLPRFLDVNRVTQPDLLIFNTPDWTSEHWAEFAYGRPHVLCGAVDTSAFQPDPARRRPLTPGRWVVGGLASKNPEPLVAALGSLPDDVVLHLYGPDTHDLAATSRDAIAAGRLVLTGSLEEAELPQFYRRVDCVATTETGAGWANLAAEAMASGVPVICTRAGSLAFARHEENALVLDAPEPAAISEAVIRLRDDSALAARFATAGRQTMTAFSWEAYATAMLELLDADRPGL